MQSFGREEETKYRKPVAVLSLEALWLAGRKKRRYLVDIILYICNTQQCNLGGIYVWLILYLYQHCQQNTTILIGLDKKKDEYWTLCLILISI